MIRKNLPVIFTLVILVFGSYMVWPNTWNRELCSGGTVTFKETSNNYYPGVIAWFFNKSPAKSDEAPQHYILHVEDGGLFCDSKHFAVDADTWNSLEPGSEYES